MKNPNLVTYYKARSASMPHYLTRAIDAWRNIQSDRKLAAWKAEIDATSFYTDSHNVAHEFEENGFKYVFKIEPDYDGCDAEDYFPRKGGKNSQGYEVYDVARYEEDHNKPPRYQAGKGMTLYADIGNYRQCYWKRFELPEEYVRQFYDNRNYSRQVAYENMIASAKLAIEQGIKTVNLDYCYISVTAYDAEGHEVATDGLGGVDSDYATSGQAFFEHGMLETCKQEVDKELIKNARAMEKSRPDMYASV